MLARHYRPGERGRPPRRGLGDLAWARHSQKVGDIVLNRESECRQCWDDSLEATQFLPARLTSMRLQPKRCPAEIRGASSLSQDLRMDNSKDSQRLCEHQRLCATCCDGSMVWPVT